MISLRNSLGTLCQRQDNIDDMKTEQNFLFFSFGDWKTIIHSQCDHTRNVYGIKWRTYCNHWSYLFMRLMDHLHLHRTSHHHTTSTHFNIKYLFSERSAFKLLLFIRCVFFPFLFIIMTLFVAFEYSSKYMLCHKALKLYAYLRIISVKMWWLRVRVWEWESERERESKNRIKFRINQRQIQLLWKKIQWKIFTVCFSCADIIKRRGNRKKKKINRINCENCANTRFYIKLVSMGVEIELIMMPMFTNIKC